MGRAQQSLKIRAQPLFGGRAHLGDLTAYGIGLGGKAGTGGDLAQTAAGGDQPVPFQRIEKAEQGAGVFRPVAAVQMDRGDHRGPGIHIRRQKFGFADQGIEQGGFPGFHLTDHADRGLERADLFQRAADLAFNETQRTVGGCGKTRLDIVETCPIPIQLIKPVTVVFAYQSGFPHPVHPVAGRNPVDPVFRSCPSSLRPAAGHRATIYGLFAPGPIGNSPRGPGPFPAALPRNPIFCRI